MMSRRFMLAVPLALTLGILTLVGVAEMLPRLVPMASAQGTPTPLRPKRCATNAVQVVDVNGYFNCNASTTIAPSTGNMAVGGNLTVAGTISGGSSASGQFAALGVNTTPGATGTLTIAGGTQTTSVPFINAAQTWNSGGVTFTGILANITSTASAAGSLLLDLQVASASKFSVNKSGNIANAGTLATTGNATVGGTLGVTGASTLASAGITGAATVGTTLDVTGNTTVGGTLGVTGALTSAAVTDIVMFYPAVTACVPDDANLVPTRLAANNWALARTAGGAETYNITCSLTAPTRTTSGKGYKLTAFKIAQQITVAALTSNTFNALATTTYVNNVASAVAGYGGVITVTMPTATQANPYLTAASVGTPAFMNTADAVITADFTAVMANTGVYRLYGISATWTEQN